MKDGANGEEPVPYEPILEPHVPDFGGRPPITTHGVVTQVEEKVIVAADQVLDSQKKEKRAKEVVVPEEM